MVTWYEPGVEELPDMDSNHDKVNQNHLCYHYTIGQKARGDVTGAGGRRSSLEGGIYRPALLRNTKRPPETERR